MLLLLLHVFVLVVTMVKSGVDKACEGQYSHYPFCNTSLSTDERVKDLISRLNLTEKATLLIARESPLNSIPRLGIPEYDWVSVNQHFVAKIKHKQNFKKKTKNKNKTHTKGSKLYS